ARIFKGGIVEGGMVLAGRGSRAREGAAHEDDILTHLRKAPARVVDERGLASAGTAGRGDEDAILKRKAVRFRRALGGGGGRHATRSPSRQTVLTTGTSPSRRTRTRSAQRPAAIAPRSVSPTASAGFFETMATASGRVMPSTTRSR